MAALVVEETCVRRWFATYTSCQCPACSASRARMRKRSRAGLVPPSRTDEAWEVLDELVARGWSSLAIASATGLSQRGVLNALEDLRKRGHRRQFGRVIAARIIGHGEPTRGYVSAVGSRRRLQALAVVGWSLEDLAARSGLPVMTLSVIRGGRVASTRPGTAGVVEGLYRRFSVAQGPSPAAAAHAAASGWVSALAWDDDIDDPQAVPCGVTPRGKGAGLRVVSPVVDDLAVDIAVTGPAVEVPRLTPAERREVVARLVREGWSSKRIAARLGVTARTVDRDRDALGLTQHEAAVG